MKHLYALAFFCFLLFSNNSFSQSVTYHDALDFDGYNDRVTIQPDEAFDFAEGTVEAWVQPKLLSGANMMILGNRAYNNTRYSIHINANTIGLWNGNSYYTVYLNTPFRVGAWYHIAAAIGISSTAFYVDGKHIGTTANGMGSATGLPIEIGNTNDDLSLTETFNGSIGGVRFWSSLRTAEEIESDMYDTTSTASSLVAYYKLNETTGEEAADVSGNNRNGTLYNFALTGDRSNWVRDFIIGTPVATDADSLTSISFKANWEAPVGDTISAYLLDVAYDQYFTNPLPGFAQLNVGNVLSYSVTGLSAIQTYYYRVRAVKDSIANEGPYSNTISITTLPRLAMRMYVNANATTGLNNGTSWNNAFVKLQDALSSSAYGDTIWVAKGNYQPDINASFSLSADVKLFGGFAGTEHSLSQRILTPANATVLQGSGSHILSNYYIGQSTEIDGFTFVDAYYAGSNSPIPESFKGLAIYNYRSYYIIRNCTFKNNKFDLSGEPATYQGAAIYNDESSPIISSCVFENNSSGSGGAITNYFSDIKIFNSVFSNNSANSAGGAIENLFSSSSLLTGCVFYGNNTTATGLGSVMYNYNNSDAIFVNCTITNNHSFLGSQYQDLIVSVDGATATISNTILFKNDGIIENINAPKIKVAYSLLDFAYDGDNIAEGDPLFADAENPAGADGVWATADDGLQLKAGSTAINAGSNDWQMMYVPVPTDIIGNIRIQNDTVDIGSYEYIGSILPVTLASFKVISSNCSATLNWKAAQETGVQAYTIEKSADGTHFTSVVTIPAQNRSGSSYNYNYNSSNETTLYFRLKIVDRNGKTDYSATEKAVFNCQNIQIAMTPNPVKNVLMITHLSGVNLIQVYNISGQLVSSLKTGNASENVDMTSLSAGVYLVKVVGNNAVLTTQKVVKQ